MIHLSLSLFYVCCLLDSATSASYFDESLSYQQEKHEKPHHQQQIEKVDVASDAHKFTADKNHLKHKKEGQEEFPTFVDPVPDPSFRKVEARMALQPKFRERQEKMFVDETSSSTVFIAVATVCSAAAVFGLVGAGVCWHRLQKTRHGSKEDDYPKYGLTGPDRERTSGCISPVAAMDAKLASSAQLYHYQHTKQQIIAMEQSSCETKGNESDDSEGEDEGNYSVYECPGLAPTGDIEVNNPLFEHSSPVTKTDPKRDQASVHKSFE